MDTTEILFQLFVILAGGQLAALACRQLRQPVVVGEILVGVVLGPSVLGLIAMNPEHPTELSGPLFALAELGVIVLMFTVGLETPVRSISRVGAPAFAVAVGGVVLPFVAGWGVMALLGYSGVASLFLATALVATSVGVTARVLGDLGVLDRRTSKVVLGAAVIDDVLGLLVLTLVTSGAREGVDVGEVLLTVVFVVVFIGVLVSIGPRVARRARPRLERAEPTVAFLVSLVLLVGLAALSAWIGLAAIVGAFLAGVVLAEEIGDIDLVRQVETLGAFLTPVFFVGVGAAVDLGTLATPAAVGLVLLVVGIAIVTKFAGAGVAARLTGSGALEAATVGVGMVPRGEVGIIVATTALALGAVDGTLFATVVAMSVVTTLIAPPVLAVLVRRGGAEVVADTANEPRDPSPEV